MTEFGRRLRAVIREKGLSQTQVCSMTGKSKASISQYLSGTQLPPEKTQTEIAVALGLDVDYFNPQPVISQDEAGDAEHVNRIQGLKPIIRISVEEAAELMRASPQTIRKGLEQGKYPWGYSVKTSETKHTYLINLQRLIEIEKIEHV